MNISRKEKLRSPAHAGEVGPGRVTQAKSIKISDEMQFHQAQTTTVLKQWQNYYSKTLTLIIKTVYLLYFLKNLNYKKKIF